MSKKVKRLIDWFEPSKYNLSISQDTNVLTFSGEVEIEGVLTALALKEGRLFLHSSDLNISEVSIGDVATQFKLNEKKQEVEIKLSGLRSKDIKVKLKFDGTITIPMHGLYPCFFEHEGQEKRLLATQFESHHAREVFPCVDEPEAKAVFSLQLKTNINDTVVSNTPILSEIKDQKTGLKSVQFEPTPLMSTYLLAWVSGELIFEESSSKSGVKVRTYSTPVHKGKLSYANEVLVKAMDFLEDYFAIPYPLTKFDQVALPDFAAGAMENWGCVTFREAALLFDPENSNLADKQYIADVVIHELSHQWFGNLVTMRWWNDLWLNEGFASWIPYLVRDELYPEWKIWDHFATGDLALGLRADALENTHPIVVEINSPDEIRSAFDNICYDKGCSVINLVYNLIGKNAFRNGLRAYLKRHAYGNAETHDLWQAWSDASGIDVGKFMKVWTEKPGFPVVKVEDGRISQSRFLLSGESQDQTIWTIPLMTIEGDGTVLDTNSKKITLKNKINIGQSGFFRVIYDGKIRIKILDDINSYSAVDALGLLSDTAEAAKPGLTSTTEVLELISHLKDRQEEVLISSALTELAEIRLVMGDTFEALKPFTAKFIAPNLERLGFEQRNNDSLDDELLRPSILAAASYSGLKDVVEFGINMFINAKSPEDIRSDIRSFVYQTAIRENNDLQTFEKLLNWYKTTTVPGEQAVISAALCSARDPELAIRALNLIISDTVKLQESTYWIAYSLRNRFNKKLAWDWLRENWDWVSKNFAREKALDNIIKYAANGFTGESHLVEYTDFFNSVDIFGSKRAFEQGKERILWQTAWKERDEKKVLGWLNDFTY